LTLLIISCIVVALCIGKPSDTFDWQPLSGPRMRHENEYDVFLFIGVSLIILGAKLSLINSYGSDLPYWDQWDVEPQDLYIPYDHDVLSWITL
jgi:hypothetical protein